MMARLLSLALIGYVLACAAGILGVGYLWMRKEPAPEQPLPFSHARHVGELELACEDCHLYVRRGPRATVPPMSVCADCHAEMESEDPAVLALQERLERREPVEWIQVHRVPWHVHFNHKRHLQAEIDCSVCHGQVQGMERLRRVRSLDMGWCVSCHRHHDAPDDCLICHK